MVRTKLTTLRRGNQLFDHVASLIRCRFLKQAPQWFVPALLAPPIAPPTWRKGKKDLHRIQHPEHELLVRFFQRTMVERPYRDLVLQHNMEQMEPHEFVRTQLKLMEEKGLSEDEAYDAVQDTDVLRREKDYFMRRKADLLARRVKAHPIRDVFRAYKLIQGRRQAEINASRRAPGQAP